MWSLTTAQGFKEGDENEYAADYNEDDENNNDDLEDNGGNKNDKWWVGG